MLKLRILTAILLIPLVILAIFFLPQPYFSGVCAIITLLAAWEFAPFIGWSDTSKKILYCAIVLACLLLSFLFRPGLPIVFGVILWGIITTGLIIIRIKSVVPYLPEWLVSILGVIILVAFWKALSLTHFIPQILLMLLIFVWTADTAAYFGGRIWGKKPLAPMLSPKKTVEGFVCGLVMTLVVALISAYFLPYSKYFLLKWMLIAFFTFIAAVAGDLFESLLKRQANVKDSGQLLPGHGGLLDRIDSLLAAAPVFFVSVVMLNL